jgi:cellulose synthase operon protein C
MPPINFARLRLLALLVLCPLSVVLSPSQSVAQVAPDQAADMLLASARRAYNEKNYPFAAQRFKEFLDKYGNHKEAQSARYGLALALLDGPERDYQRALDTLQPLAGAKEFADFPFVLYYLGAAQRGVGVRELAQAEAKPQEAPQHRNAANGRFDEASKQFAAAVTAFTARVKGEIPADAKELPVDLEWAARARCDQAEMQLRTRKMKEAQATAALFVKDDVLKKSRYRTLGLYYHGTASFLLKDYQTAGRSLNVNAVLADPVFGTHARYLVARIHHMSDEGAEAATGYEAVLADFAKEKNAAVEALKQPDKVKNDPEEKLRLEALARGPAPDHVNRATLYLGELLYEAGKYADAQARFAAFAQANPGTPLTAEANLRLGFCQVQQKQFPEAVKTLQPLADKEPRLADQALLWIAKAQAGAADPAKPPQEYENALKTAIETCRRAAEKAQGLTNNDPEAKTRRAEILLEMADVQQLARQFKEAVNTYNQIVNEKALPDREEEITQRQATALHLGGDYAESDRVCLAFQQKYPRSSLLPEVLFRHAENAYFVALAAEKNPNLPDRANALARMHDEVIKRYGIVIEKYPEFDHVNLARYGVAMGHYRKGDLDKAVEVLKKIPDADRTGDLALVPYLQADCLIKTAPVKADDALAAGKLEEQLKEAIGLLDAFTNAQAASPQTPDALVKLGFCHQRMAGLLADKQEKDKSFAAARAAYEKVTQQFPKHELFSTALLERAKVIAATDVNGAVNELRRFQNDANLKVAPVAPTALLQLATYLRNQNKAQEAAEVLAKCRQENEEKLKNDPTRAAWVPLLQYHHGLALKESGKRAEARTVLEGVIKGSPNRPEAAEAALRWGQSLKEDGLTKIGEAQKKLANPGLKSEEKAAANKALEDGLKDVRDAVTYLETQADGLKARQPPVEARARMLYEAAWGSRTVGDIEATAVRTKLQQERWEKLKDQVAKKTPPGQTPPSVPLPVVPMADVPLQPAEQKARSDYRALIDSFPDLSLTGDARFELAELHADRNDHDTAIKMLRETLDKEPPADLTDKIRVRLGACLVAKGDNKAALGQFAAVYANAKSPYAGQAYYRAGESQLALGEAAEAVKLLAVFRDRPEFQNLAGVTDKALLRLGHALAQQKQWDASRQAHEQVVGRFPQSGWVHEARYGIGWAHQNQNHIDEAVNVYQQVANGTATEIGAKAQLQIGLCRLEQKRYPEAATALLVVPFTYDYPEWNAVALVEAARTFGELKQNEQAVKLLQRVIRDYPDSKWAEVAKERLAGIKGS